MDKVAITPPSGTRDFFSGDVKFRENAISIIKKRFELFGFQPLETPAFERLDVLAGKYGEEEKLIFKILKRGDQASSGEADLALRYDFTIPLARYVANLGLQTGDCFKRYQIGPVWRADRPAKGRFREFYQCDVDIVGSSSRLADVEVILAVSSALQFLGLEGFTIHLNSRKILRGLMEIYKVPREAETDAIMALDKLSKIGPDGVIKELIERGIPSEVTKLIEEDFMSDAPIHRLKDRLLVSDIGKNGISEVEEIEALVSSRLNNAKIIFDPYIARGLDYYTGFVFEVFYENDSTKLPLSIASGGRYDNLVGMFLSRSIPACGGSVGFERVLLLLDQQDKKIEAFPNVMVAVWDNTFYNDAITIASLLRANGISTELSLREGKIGNQIRQADKRKIPICVLRGPDEKEKHTIAIKNLITGKQCIVDDKQVVDAVKKELLGII